MIVFPCQAGSAFAISTLLFGPTLTSGAVYPLRDRNTQVLVKGDQPVVLGRLCEQGALNRNRFDRQEFRDSMIAHQALCKLTAPRQLDQASRPDSLVNETINIPGDLLQICSTDNRRNDSISRLVHMTCLSRRLTT